MLVNAYIAFSIHGSNTFIVATKQVNISSTATTITDYAGVFKKAVSRRPNWKPADGQKLTWDKLMKADGTPHTNPGWVLRRFNQLEKAGWAIVNKDKFIQKHYNHGKHNNPVPRRQ